MLQMLGLGSVQRPACARARSVTGRLQTWGIGSPSIVAALASLAVTLLGVPAHRLTASLLASDVLLRVAVVLVSTVWNTALYADHSCLW